MQSAAMAVRGILSAAFEKARIPRIADGSTACLPMRAPEGDLAARKRAEALGRFRGLENKAAFWKG